MSDIEQEGEFNSDDSQNKKTELTEEEKYRLNELRNDPGVEQYIKLKNSTSNIEGKFAVVDTGFEIARQLLFRENPGLEERVIELEGLERKNQN
ncbi:MAG: hypothetical protein PHE59_00025 [Patescibacteria group bacterium]|nr:hypothetical protein [Patescibacteria group bacterium]MDD5164560.1 hypothetical protein [Patescibacteria group bacterium]MDD5534315.1 hypothetical protein [Patescibacteria group bacterium]